jgi:GNAT superfamily N-acetyltransferase
VTAQATIRIEPFAAERHGDLVAPLTAMLHRAYRPLADEGLRYLATHQPPEVTLSRLRSGDAFLGFAGDRLVATITIVKRRPDELCEWYRRDDVFFFTQLAVSPEHQGAGIARGLMDFAEQHARKLGARELALDTSEKATRLNETYLRRGYRRVGHVSWRDTNYRSVVLSKTLATGNRGAAGEASAGLG